MHGLESLFRSDIGEFVKYPEPYSLDNGHNNELDSLSQVESESRIDRKLYRSLKNRKSETLGRALRRLGYRIGRRHWQRWRVSLWIRCGLVYVERRKETTKRTNPKFKVRPADVILIRKKMSGDCRAAFYKLKSNADNYRDYFLTAPLQGLTDIYIASANSALKARPNTVRLSAGSGAKVQNLKNVVRLLSLGTRLAHPIRNLYLVSHFHPFGNLSFPLKKEDFNPSNYFNFRSIQWSDLESIVSSKIVQIDKKAVLPRPKQNSVNQPFHVHIRGCALGTRPKYVDKLRDAFGGHVTVTAPKYWNGFISFNRKGETTNVGYVEYMGYDFAVFTPYRAKNRRSLLRLFIHAKLKDIHGKRISSKVWKVRVRRAWKAMVAERVDLKTEPFLTRIHFRRLSLRPATKFSLDFETEFQAQRLTLFGDSGSFVSHPIPEPKNRRDKKKKYSSYVNMIKTQLEKTKDFKSDNPFPVWERLGFNSIQEFMKGFYWDLTWTDGNKMSFKAIRYRYAFIVPITQKKGKRLYMNFYPEDRTKDSYINLVEDDSRFFYKTA